MYHLVHCIKYLLFIHNHDRDTRLSSRTHCVRPAVPAWSSGGDVQVGGLLGDQLGALAELILHPLVGRFDRREEHHRNRFAEGDPNGIDQ